MIRLCKSCFHLSQHLIYTDVAATETKPFTDTIHCNNFSLKTSIKTREPEALLLPLIHFSHCIRAQNRWFLCISSNDAVDPRQVWRNLHVDAVVVPAAGFVIGKDPCSVHIPSSSISDSQSAYCITKTNVSSYFVGPVQNMLSSTVGVWVLCSYSGLHVE